MCEMGSLWCLYMTNPQGQKVQLYPRGVQVVGSLVWGWKFFRHVWHILVDPSQYWLLGGDGQNMYLMIVCCWWTFGPWNRQITGPSSAANFRCS